MKTFPNQQSEEVYEKISEKLYNLLSKSNRDTPLSASIIKQSSGLLQQAMIQNQIDECYEACQAGEGTKFYRTSEVINLQNDPSKIRFGKNGHLKGTYMIMRYGGEIIGGDGLYAGERCNLWSANKILMEDNVLMSYRVNIMDSDHHETNPDDRRDNFTGPITAKDDSMTQGNKIESKPVVLEEDLWINFDVTILKGVRIGKGSVIGAYSMVTKDIPPYSLVVGNPARIIRSLK